MKRTERFIFAAVIMLLASLKGFCFGSEEVIIVNSEEGSVLAGTLTKPTGKIKAALVLASGSGEQDRDETVFGHKPFKVIAERLSDNGYAVLRLDDRSVGGSTGKNLKEGVTTLNFVNDICRATTWLDSVLADVPVGVLGHSEGGQIAYRAANASPKVRFIITLAAPAWKGDSLVMAQCRALAMGAMGRWDGEGAQRRILDVAMSNLPSLSALPIITSEIASTLGDAAKMPQTQEFIALQAQGVLFPWYREFLRYDPIKDITAVKIPWLAINGDRDCQVPVANLQTIKELNPNADIKVMEGHNHLLQHCSSGLPNEYAQLEEDISDDTIEVIIHWLEGLPFDNN